MDQGKAEPMTPSLPKPRAWCDDNPAMLKKLSSHLLVSPSSGTGPVRKRHPEI
jgi:hypothetical protein